jgi:hypothetical protein
MVFMDKMKLRVVRCPRVIQILDAITAKVVGDLTGLCCRKKGNPSDSPLETATGYFVDKSKSNQLCGITLCPLLRGTLGWGPF